MAFQAASQPFFPPAPAQVANDQVSVPGVFVATGQGLVGLTPLAAPAFRPPTPADQGIQASPGDDTSAPNATTAERINHVVCVTSANVGYSSAAKDTNIPPSAVDYDAEIVEGQKGYGMTLRIRLTYASSFPQEGMVVWLKKRQQMINNEKLSELLLIETAFEDYVDGKWVPITTDIRYAEEAEAVVQAVITSDSGQTAGRVQTSDAVEDAKLGPVGEQGRIVLTYFCEQLYSYGQMALPGEEQAGSRTLVPLSLQLPWAPCDSPAAQCRVAVRVRGPAGSCLLDPGRHVLAYSDLKQSFLSQQLQTVLIVPAPAADAAADAPSWAFGRETLPPMSAAVLAWLSVPDPADDGWEEVGNALPSGQSTRATLLRPSPEDEAFLKAALPGGQVGQLLRCRLETAPPKRDPNVTRVHTDITISDASGSTGMSLRGGFGLGGANVRSGFNRTETRRVLARLQTVPMLRAQGLLLPQDTWRQHFVVFDSGVRADFELESKVAELSDTTVANLCKALNVDDAAQQAEGAAALTQAGRDKLLHDWRGLLEKLHGLSPGGTTSFVAGADRAHQRYTESKGRTAALAGGRVEHTTYVNFDTDGGNNCGPCYDAIKRLVADADVVQGHVLGVGAWVDQDCASKVAKLLKGSASLALSFPEQAAADAQMRQDLSRWVKVWRSCPLTVAASAGAESWVARHGVRSENAVECILAGGAEGLRFEAPDVTETAFTKAQLAGLQAGETALLYFVSRLPLAVLQQRLRIELPGAEAAGVAVAAEPLRGVALGHHWLAALGGAPGLVANGAALCTRLRQRLEDDLSFAWNLPTKSGSTAALGRARTQQRPPVPAAQQPEEPKLPEPPKPTMQGVFGGGMCKGGGGKGPPPAWKGTGAPPPGGKGKGPPPPGGQGPPPPPGGACWGPSCGFGAPPGGIGPAIGNLRGAPAAAGAGGLFGASAGGGLAGGFGASAPSSASAPAPGGAMLKAKRVKSGFPAKGPGKGGLFGAAQPQEAEPPQGAQAPKELLTTSNCMRAGPEGSTEADVQRAVTAVRYLARFSAGGPGAAPARPEAEDPLVSALFGQAPAQPAGQQAVVHHGFVCDACQANPIAGVRFKASSKVDVDICFACRSGGRLAGAGGFRALADAAVALRHALLALLEWWPLAWAKAGPAPPALPFPEGALAKPGDVQGLALPHLRELAERLPCSDLPA